MINACMLAEITTAKCISDDYVNGCSIPFRSYFPYAKFFEKACDKHDICYDCVSISFFYHLSNEQISSYFTMLNTKASPPLQFCGQAKKNLLCVIARVRFCKRVSGTVRVRDSFFKAGFS